MRTTVVIEERLLRRAKELAAQRGLTLSALVEQALRDELRQVRLARADTPPFRMPIFGEAAETYAHEPSDFAAALAGDDDAAVARDGA